MTLVTTQNHVYVDGIKKDIPNCYGIEHKYNCYFVSCYENDKSVIKKYDNEFNFIEIIKTKYLNDVHEIRFINDDLLITNTSKDSLYSVNSGQYIKLSNNDHDGLHINSIFYDDDIYVLCANGQIVFVLDTDYNIIGEFKIPYNLDIPKEECSQYAGWFHNLILLDGWFYTCEKYGFVRFTKDKFEVLIKKPLVFMRGLSYNNGIWIIGQSENKPRPERGVGNGVLLYYDNEFNLIDTVILKNSGQIKDIY